METPCETIHLEPLITVNLQNLRSELKTKHLSSLFLFKQTVDKFKEISMYKIIFFILSFLLSSQLFAVGVTVDNVVFNKSTTTVSNPPTNKYKLFVDNETLIFKNSSGVERAVGLVGFDNETPWVPCTFSTLTWGGYGTVTNNLECSQDKSTLRIRGGFVTGTVGALTAFIPMPTNYGVINAKKIASRSYSIGNTYRDVASQYVLQNIFINSAALDNNLYTSNSVISVTSATPYTGVNGNVSFSNNQWVGINGELSIPIVEWQSRSNAAFFDCAEGDLNCYDSGFKFTRNADGSLSNVYPANWISCGAISSGASNCTYNNSMALSQVMSCDASFNTTGAVQSGAAETQITNMSPTAMTVTTFNTSFVGTNYTVTVHCSKNGDDRRNGSSNILMFAGATGQTIDMRGPGCPIGTLPEDGREISRSKYASLFSYIGTLYGAGDGTTTFNLPDSRGKANMASMTIANATGSGTVSTNNATFTAHQFLKTGTRVRIVSGTLTGLATNTDYYTIYVGPNQLAFATTYANALAGTKITISGTNSAVIRQSVTASNTTVGNVIEDTFQGHTHDYYGAQSGTGNTSGAGTSAFRAFTTHGIQKDTLNGSVRSGQVTAPYHLVTTRCIKY